MNLLEYFDLIALNEEGKFTAATTILLGVDGAGPIRRAKFGTPSDP